MTVILQFFRFYLCVKRIYRNELIAEFTLCNNVRFTFITPEVEMYADNLRKHQFTYRLLLRHFH